MNSACNSLSSIPLKKMQSPLNELTSLSLFSVISKIFLLLTRFFFSSSHSIFTYIAEMFLVVTQLGTEVSLRYYSWPDFLISSFPWTTGRFSQKRKVNCYLSVPHSWICSIRASSPPTPRSRSRKKSCTAQASSDVIFSLHTFPPIYLQDAEL